MHKNSTHKLRQKKYGTLCFSWFFGIEPTVGRPFMVGPFHIDSFVSSTGTGKVLLGEKRICNIVFGCDI